MFLGDLAVTKYSAAASLKAPPALIFPNNKVVQTINFCFFLAGYIREKRNGRQQAIHLRI
jgi:hypothetical protein